MTPAQLARAADQQRDAIACFTREAARIEAERSDIAAAVDDFTVRHTDLTYLQYAATARATRVGPGPDRPVVRGGN